MYFIDEAARIAKPDTKDKNELVVGMPVVSVKIGDHCYHGLCDLHASVSAISFTIYHGNNEVLYKRVLTPFRDGILNRHQVSVCDRWVLTTRP